VARAVETDCMLLIYQVRFVPSIPIEGSSCLRSGLGESLQGASSRARTKRTP